jgi:hypothetical protein
VDFSYQYAASSGQVAVRQGRSAASTAAAARRTK